MERSLRDREFPARGMAAEEGDISLKRSAGSME